MAQVAVQINGKTFRMACEEGQEQHLMNLARDLDGTIATLRESFGEIGDQRLTVMAGVMMADQLSEARARISVLEADLRKAGAPPPRPERDERLEGEVAAALDHTAERIERIGEKLKTVPRP